MNATNAWVYEVSMMFSDVERGVCVRGVFCIGKTPLYTNLILQRQNNISSIYNFLNSDSTLFLKTVNTVSESWLSCLCLNVMWIYIVLVVAMFATYPFACKCFLKMSMSFFFFWMYPHELCIKLTQSCTYVWRVGSAFLKKSVLMIKSKVLRVFWLVFH